MNKNIIIIGLLAIVFLGSCGKNKVCKNTVALNDTSFIASTMTLADFLYKSGNIITNKDFPPLVHSIEIIQHKEQYLIIDIRTPEKYKEGHIEGAYNVQRDELLDFFKNEQNPAGFEKIAIVDDNGPLAVYLATLLQLSGYNNAYGLKFGIATWNSKFEEEISKHLSNKYAAKMDTTPTYRPAPSNLPNLETNDIVGLLSERLELTVSDTITNIIISPDEVFNNLDNYFLLAYWSKDKFVQGHIPGSFQYDIRSELSPNIALNTLPTDKRIVVYCNTGHHAIAIVAYLKLLGYDAVSMMYGLNSFMNIDLAKIAAGASVTNASALTRDYPILEGEDRISNPLKTERDSLSNVKFDCAAISGLFPRLKIEEIDIDINYQFANIDTLSRKTEIYEEKYHRENLH